MPKWKEPPLRSGSLLDSQNASYARGIYQNPLSGTFQRQALIPAFNASATRIDGVLMSGKANGRRRFAAFPPALLAARR
ncbi:MAG TPA: hypothetical protein VNH18_33545 [Bryobacteraceae bacterium]|nr:hypothetical protein [Bryobacteraceae bacterium]